MWKSFTVCSDASDVNTMPLMVAQNVNSLNNTMRNVYQQQSQSQPCSPHIERKDLHSGSAPTSPKLNERKGFILTGLLFLSLSPITYYICSFIHICSLEIPTATP